MSSRFETKDEGRRLAHSYVDVVTLVLLFGLRTEVNEPERVDLVGERRRREVRTRTRGGEGKKNGRSRSCRGSGKKILTDMSRNESQKRETEVD